jgi:hypothetical protein
MAEQNFAVLTPTEAVDVIFETLMADETARDRVMLMGRHGVGKSTAMRDVVARMDEHFEGGAELIDVRCLQLDLGSFRGLERIVQTEDGDVETIPARPYFLPKYEPNVTAKTRRYVIFLDELMAADDAIRKAAFEILTDHRSGPHLLGTNVYVVGAGNAAEEGTNVHELDWATRDRFTFIRLEPSHAGIIERFTAKNVHYHMLAFVRNNPGFLEASESDYENNNLAAPSPRTLESASNTLWAYERGKTKKITRDVGLKGKMGMAAAGVLIAAIEDEEARFDLMKLVAAKPEEREYPRNTFGVFSLAGALAAYAEDADKLDKAIDIMICMPDEIVDCADEVKTVFIQMIGDKLTQWRLIFKYALDPRVRPFLTDSEEILLQADREHAERMAAEGGEGRAAA